ncbi:sulfotransferase [Georgenia sp. TF02-10]|uniref:sulfotransferase family protein n=1 Tax=Georgenia sp. TF02-10 TaxID=2917725 RepID=UPI001FA74666|nr:sulfotransferase [Georgenia sp. TF02-10]UNX55585.1 sulfotransferase [Georgenia sp. TF02-10]
MELTVRVRSAARRVVRSGYTVLGEATADARMRPGFIIAGAQRCGTTSLFRMLAAHPDVRPPAYTKGIHYFDTAERYRRGPRFYGAHFPLAPRGRDHHHLVTGEASPYYVFHPLAAERIAREVPDARVIVLLRDPVERAFSAHKQETWRGFETLSFEEALAAEPDRLAGEVERMVADPAYQSFAHQHYAYVGRGRYAAQLTRMFDAVGRDQVLVLDADDFFADPQQYWSEVLAHVGLRDVPLEAAPKANARPSSPMPATARARLEEAFADSDEELTRILGRVPSWRR